MENHYHHHHHHDHHHIAHDHHFHWPIIFSLCKQIKVKGPKAEETVSLEVAQDIGVLELKEKVAASSLAIPAASQRLIFTGKILKDGQTIKDYNGMPPLSIGLVL